MGGGGGGGGGEGESQRELSQQIMFFFLWFFWVTNDVKICYTNINSITASTFASSHFMVWTPIGMPPWSPVLPSPSATSTATNSSDTATLNITEGACLYLMAVSTCTYIKQSAVSHSKKQIHTHYLSHTIMQIGYLSHLYVISTIKQKSHLPHF